MQMSGNYGQDILLWPASDGIIEYGSHPGFGNNPLSGLPKRFLAASGGNVELFSPQVASAIKGFAAAHQVSVQELVEPEPNKYLTQHIAQRQGLLTESEISDNKAKGNPPFVMEIDPNEMRRVEQVRAAFATVNFNGRRYGTVADRKSWVGQAFVVFDGVDKLKDKGNWVADANTGRLGAFVEKPIFADIVDKVVEKGNGTDVINAFNVMADKQTVWDLFITKFSSQRNDQHQLVSEIICSFFDKVFGGGLMRKDRKHPVSNAVVEYMNENPEVQVLGFNYGEGYYFGDIGNLDLNARMYFLVIADRSIDFDHRRNTDSIVIPPNVVVNYGQGKRKKKLDDLAESERSKALFLLKNVRITADDRKEPYELNLAEGSGIISSVIRFSKKGLTTLDLTKGSVIVDSEIDGPVVFRNEYALLEGVMHIPLQGINTYDYKLASYHGGMTDKFGPTPVLEVWGGETTGTLFIHDKDGSVKNVVSRVWNLDLKGEIGAVSMGSGNLPAGIMAVILDSKSRDVSKKGAETLSMGAQELSYRQLTINHPRLLGIPGVSEWRHDVMVRPVIKLSELSGLTSIRGSQFLDSDGGIKGTIWEFIPESTTEVRLRKLDEDTIVEIPNMPDGISTGDLLKLDAILDRAKPTTRALFDLPIYHNVYFGEALQTVDSVIERERLEFVRTAYATNQPYAYDSAAMVTQAVDNATLTSEKIPGGINLSSKNLYMESEGDKVNIAFNPAMIAQFKRGDFSGIKVNILETVPVNVMQVLGLKKGI